MFVVSLFFCLFFLGDALTSNDVPYEVKSGFIFYTNESVTSLANPKMVEPSTHAMLLSAWSKLHMYTYDWKVKDKCLFYDFKL